MRYKSSTLYTALALLVAVLIVFLGMREQLDVYIHPRYTAFTVGFALLGALLLCIRPNASYAKGERFTVLAYIPFLVIVAAMVLLPVRSLTSATIAQRSGAGSVVMTLSDYDQQNKLFSGSSRTMTLTQWSKSLAINTDAAYYRNKPAKISGFLYDSGAGADIVQLSRFVVTCCAVDAQPVSVPIYVKNWSQRFGQDQWVEVEGEFREMKVTGASAMVLNVTAIKKIPEPRNPYAQ